ncbi:glycosyltransferase family 2 protein [Pontixanthobacter gangjinensis]|uniref:Glycosyltransferase family 2 protein n=1 Tax=Christiangramia aestuarii TaxID=1028746 RepID=A0A7K1LRA7_9FLAO|nr:glycosyltransferase family 2 protein [Christiangramia aestuarii]MUP43344.1 glycosyltransferase family 2 protein [Christiangramia aestuarii]
MMNNGLVSVIMPAYNSEAFIAEAIRSVIQQTYPDWELLIIDDASTDATKKIIRKLYQDDNRIRLLENSENRGTHYTRNKGIKAAQGDFIAFLDADDLWKPEKLKKQLELLSKENLAACFSSYELMAEDASLLNKKIEALPELTYDKLLKANYVGNLTGVYDQRKLGKIYCPDISKRQDWALWLNVIEKGGPMKGIREPLAIYRLRKNSISTNKLEMLRYNFNIYHKILGYDLLSSTWKMLIFLNEQFFVKSRQVKSTISGK